jgi:spore germination protein KB
MGGLALAAALGPPRSLVRTARMVRPIVLGVLFLLFVFACFSIEPQNLIPIGKAEIIPCLMGSAVSIDIISCSAVAMCIIMGSVRKQEGDFRQLSLWTAECLFLLSMLGIAIIGSFGSELSACLTRPFFVLVKNMVFFRTVERVEALVVMLWIFPDFLLTSLFLWAGQYAFRLMLGLDAKHTGPALDFSCGRCIIWLCAIAVTVFALLIAPDALRLEIWSAYIIPALNLSFAFLFFPLIYIIGKEKGRL